MSKTAITVAVPRAAMVALAIFVVVVGVLLSYPTGDYPDLHTILDTAIALLSGILALLLWDMGEHSQSRLPRWLAISFGATFLLEIVHVLVTVEWSGSLAPIREAQGVLRPSTWPPATHLLPIGLGVALWCARRNMRDVAGFAVAMTALGAGLFFAYQQLPTYLPPGPLGITRPALIGAPLLWILFGVTAWRMRRHDRLIEPLTWMAIALILANIAMLYSRAPADGPAMAAHLGKISGRLILLFLIMQMASGDIRERILAEMKLKQLNEELDHRVG